MKNTTPFAGVVGRGGEYMGYSESDFAGPNTAELLYEKVKPALNEAMEDEFSTVLGGVDVTAEDIREVWKQAELLKRFLCSYIDGVAAMYCIHGAGFYGDESAREELESKVGGSGKKLWHSRFKDVSKAIAHLLPYSIIPKGHQKV